MEIRLALSLTGTIALAPATPSAPPEPSLGPELWPQPEFDSATGVSLIGGAPPTISGGALRGDPSDISTARATAGETLTAGTYRVTFTVLSETSGGTFRVNVGGTFTPSHTVAGTYTVDVVSAASSQFIFAIFVDSDGVIDSLSVKKVL